MDDFVQQNQENLPLYEKVTYAEKQLLIG